MNNNLDTNCMDEGRRVAEQHAPVVASRISVYAKRADSARKVRADYSSEMEEIKKLFEELRSFLVAFPDSQSVQQAIEHVDRDLIYSIKCPEYVAVFRDIWNVMGRYVVRKSEKEEERAPL